MSLDCTSGPGPDRGQLQVLLDDKGRQRDGKKVWYYRPTRDPLPIVPRVIETMLVQGKTTENGFREPQRLHSNRGKSPETNHSRRTTGLKDPL